MGGRELEMGLMRMEVHGGHILGRRQGCPEASRVVLHGLNSHSP